MCCSRSSASATQPASLATCSAFLLVLLDCRECSHSGGLGLLARLATLGAPPGSCRRRRGAGRGSLEGKRRLAWLKPRASRLAVPCCDHGRSFSRPDDALGGRRVRTFFIILHVREHTSISPLAPASSGSDGARDTARAGLQRPVVVGRGRVPRGRAGRPPPCCSKCSGRVENLSSSAVLDRLPCCSVALRALRAGAAAAQTDT